MPSVAIVTGGAGGLGTAIAERLRRDGADVVAADLPELDVTDPESIDRLVRSVLERHDRLDVLVNSAGIAGPTAPVAEYPLEEFRRVVDTNLTGTFLCTRQCLPPMLRRGYGRIVNIASIAGVEGNPNMAAYSASKAGVIALTRSAAKELARTGVLVNCVVPAVFDAGLTDRATEAEREAFAARVPMGRMGAARGACGTRRLARIRSLLVQHGRVLRPLRRTRFVVTHGLCDPYAPPLHPHAIEIAVLG